MNLFQILMNFFIIINFFNFDELFPKSMIFFQFSWTFPKSMNSFRIGWFFLKFRWICFSKLMNFFQLWWIFFEIWWTIFQIRRTFFIFDEHLFNFDKYIFKIRWTFPSLGTYFRISWFFFKFLKFSQIQQLFSICTNLSFFSKIGLNNYFQFLF